MSDYELPVQPPPFKDRITGLVAFGVIQLCMGGLCLLGGFGAVMGALMSAQMGEEAAAAGMNPMMMLVGVLFYGAAAAWFISMGVGSVMARRWARALILVSSWLWLICGLSGVFFMLFFMGDMFDKMAESGQFPPGFGHIMKISMAVFMVMFYVIFPGALVLFYRGKSVKATCEYRNPAPSWTDACPLPVLAHVLLFAMFSVSILSLAAYHWAFPFFGVLLGDASGAAVTLMASVAAAVLAWGAFRLKPAAWWGSMAFLAVMGLSNAITFSRVDLMEFYERAGMPEQQLAMMRPLFEGGNYKSLMVFSALYWVLGILGLLLYTRRYYPVPDEREGQ